MKEHGSLPRPKKGEHTPGVPFTIKEDLPDEYIKIIKEHRGHYPSAAYALYKRVKELEREREELTHMP